MLAIGLTYWYWPAFDPRHMTKWFRQCFVRRFVLSPVTQRLWLGVQAFLHCCKYWNLTPQQRILGCSPQEGSIPQVLSIFLVRILWSTREEDFFLKWRSTEDTIWCCHNSSCTICNNSSSSNNSLRQNPRRWDANVLLDQSLWALKWWKGFV